MGEKYGCADGLAAHIHHHGNHHESRCFHVLNGGDDAASGFHDNHEIILAAFLSIKIRNMP